MRDSIGIKQCIPQWIKPMRRVKEISSQIYKLKKSLAHHNFYENNLKNEFSFKQNLNPLGSIQSKNILIVKNIL